MDDCGRGGHFHFHFEAVYFVPYCSLIGGPFLGLAVCLLAWWARVVQVAIFLIKTARHLTFHSYGANNPVKSLVFLFSMLLQ